MNSVISNFSSETDSFYIVCFIRWLSKCEKFSWPSPPAGPLGCWAPSPEPSESSDRLPWHCPRTGGTCPHVDVPVKTERRMTSWYAEPSRKIILRVSSYWPSWNSHPAAQTAGNLLGPHETDKASWGWLPCCHNNWHLWDKHLWIEEKETVRGNVLLGHIKNILSVNVSWKHFAWNQLYMLKFRWDAS